MKKIFLLFTLLISSVSFSHCPVAFTEVNLCTDLKWPKGAYPDQNNEVDFFFWANGDKTHTHVTPTYDLKIYSWMVMDNGTEHGGLDQSKKFKFNLVQLQDESYSIANAYFMGGMQGYWSVVIELKDKVTGAIVSKASAKVPLVENGVAPASGEEHNHAH